MADWERKIGRASPGLSEEAIRELARQVINLEATTGDDAHQLNADSQAQPEPETDK